MWCVPTLDAEYMQKMEDVLEVYERPHDPQQPVVCLDERAVQLRGDKRQGSPAKPGRPARFDYEYVRLGTANVFCVVEPLAGKHITRVTPNRGGAQFAKTLMLIARRYPTAKTIHLVMDNLNSHTLASMTRHYGETLGRSLWSRFAVHYTPKHGSWLNQAEIEISILNRQCMGRRRFESIATLDPQVRQWNRRVNRERLRFRWGFTTTKARTTFKYAPRADQNQAA
jgi:transposase